MVFLWLICGFVVVSAAFFIPGNQAEVWPNLNYAGIAALLYLLALIAYTLRKPFGRKAQIAVWAATFVTLGALGVHWTGMDSTSHWQHEKLLSIRAVIGRGIIQAEVPDQLLTVLDSFHHQKGKRATLQQVFLSKNPGAKVGDNVHKPNFERDSLRVFISSLSDTMIALTAQEMYVKGRDLSFKNFNGRTGMVQERFTLTAKGVRHESEN